MISVRRFLACALATAFVLAGVLGAQTPSAAQGMSADALRVEWEREPIARAGWAVEGYVYNESRYRVGGVRLRAEVLDAAGAVVAQGFGWVYGNVPSGGRAYYAVSVPRKGDAYRVTIVSSTPISRDAP